MSPPKYLLINLVVLTCMYVCSQILWGFTPPEVQLTSPLAHECGLHLSDSGSHKQKGESNNFAVEKPSPSCPGFTSSVKDPNTTYPLVWRKQKGASSLCILPWNHDLSPSCENIKPDWRDGLQNYWPVSSDCPGDAVVLYNVSFFILVTVPFLS